VREELDRNNNKAEEKLKEKQVLRQWYLWKTTIPKLVN